MKNLLRTLLLFIVISTQVFGGTIKENENYWFTQTVRVDKVLDLRNTDVSIGSSGMVVYAKDSWMVQNVNALTNIYYKFYWDDAKQSNVWLVVQSTSQPPNAPYASYTNAIWIYENTGQVPQAVATSIWALGAATANWVNVANNSSNLGGVASSEFITNNYTGAILTNLTAKGSSISLTNGTSIIDGWIGGTTAVGFVKAGTNYWILLP